MAKYKCSICGYIYDEDKESVPFSSLDDDYKCPMCGVPKKMFKLVEEEKKEVKESSSDNPLNYDKYFKSDDSIRYMDYIHDIAVNGKMVHAAMATDMVHSYFDDVLLLGASMDKSPLMDDEDVSLNTVIGKNAKKPMILESPVYISHMSFGSLSKEAKIALAKGSAKVKTATCSGEGGILEEEISNSYKYIFEYVPNKYSVTDENLKRSDAIEIKIGQGTKPGMGGHLPGDKVTEEIALVRGKKKGEDILSPSKFEEIKSKEDLKSLVSELRERSGGRPIGVKIAAGHIEEDLEYIIYSGADFVTIDGRGGATGSSPKILRDSTSIPTLFALHRARKYLDSVNSDISLIITGGFRVSSDVAKALAMGADAVAMASSPLMAMACMQYRICGSGKCPMGVATQDAELRKRLCIEIGEERVFNYLNVTNEELRMFGRITGNNNIHDLNVNDLVTVNREISENTNIKHV